MKVKFFSIFTVVASMLFAGSVFAQAMNVPTIKAEQVMSGLENPWDMAFTNGGDMFFTEKCKGLSIIGIGLRFSIKILDTPCVHPFFLWFIKSSIVMVNCVGKF